MVDLLDLPHRSAKPRERGVTHVIDRGLSIAEVDGLMEVAGDSVADGVVALAQLLLAIFADHLEADESQRIANDI